LILFWNVQLLEPFAASQFSPHVPVVPKASAVRTSLIQRITSLEMQQPQVARIKLPGLRCSPADSLARIQQ